MPSSMYWSRLVWISSALVRSISNCDLSGRSFKFNIAVSSAWHALSTIFCVALGFPCTALAASKAWAKDFQVEETNKFSSKDSASSINAKRSFLSELICKVFIVCINRSRAVCKSCDSLSYWANTNSASLRDCRNSFWPVDAYPDRSMSFAASIRFFRLRRS